MSVREGARWKFFSPNGVAFEVENIDFATLYPAVPAGIADCAALAVIPKRAVRKPFAFEIPAITPLSRPDCVLVQ